ncbi:MAG: hypothetical protein ABJD07_07750 [Gemmatimonadaceae bacterium]
MRTFRIILPFLVAVTLLIAIVQMGVSGWMIWRRNWINAAFYGGMAVAGFAISRALWGVRKMLAPPAS